MTRKLVSLILLLSFFLSSCHTNKSGSSSDSDSNYFPVKEYTLKNGLKVFLSVNKNAPRIQTAITVKAGSKYDPPQTTGLAHYLEHMLFKGSHRFGTLNYEKEKVLLDSISNLFEKRRMEPDEAKKKAIYTQIDAVSYEASKYAIPNEYDKMLSSLGAKGTNAFTDRDLTCYINDIPSNSLDKWLFVESDRFQNLVLRIFHTELEAVYEEFNRTTAEDGEWSSQAVDSMLMPNHPYGSQTTIGLSEHLKNPSMVNIHNYFDKYYVPNNCAIVLSGDLDPDKTIALIEKYFGSWKQKDVPAFEVQPAVEIKQPLYTQKFGQQPEHVFVGYRFGNSQSKDALFVKMIDRILANGKGSGLLDLNLKLQQKVLEGASFVTDNKDYTVHKLYGEPKQGQTLEQVKDLLLTQIDSIKQGKFADWVLPAVIDNMKLDMMKQAETNEGRVFDVVFAFVKDVSLDKRRQEIADLSKITKADLVKFANEHYGNNYAVCYKRTGPTALFKVEKPKITPVVLNKDSSSAFKKEFDTMKTEQLQPKFCDFKKDIQHAQLSGVQVDYIHNDVNKTFSMNYIFNMGTDNNKLLGLSLDYLPYLGTDKYSAAELKQEFYKYGLTFGVNSSRDQIKVSLSGLEEHIEDGVKLVEHLLANAKADQPLYDRMVGDIIKKREDAKKIKENILQDGLMNYGKFGAKNPFNDVLTPEQLKAVKADDLVNIVHALPTYKHHIFYYGQNNLNDVVVGLTKLHKVPAQLKDYPVATVYTEQPTDKTEVYFCNYDMKQCEFITLSKDELFNKELLPTASLFNEYYGGSMASVIFQEIREKMALAYSAYGSFSTPVKNTESHYLYAYVGTQADKMTVAVDKLNDLLNNLPEVNQNFDMAKTALMKKLESDWITRDAIYAAYERAQRRGLDYDVRQDIYTQAKNMTIADVHGFFDKHVKGKKYTYLVMGNRADVDMKALAAIGPVHELTLEQVFGY